MSKFSVHCLKHVPYEGPGMIADYLKENKIAVNTINLYEGQPLPDINSVDYLIVMGGPMDMKDVDQYPWLVKEKKLIKAMIDAGNRYSVFVSEPNLLRTYLVNQFIRQNNRRLVGILLI